MRYFLDAHHDKMQGIFRIAVGLLFVAHGAQKLFGGSFDITTLMGVAGVIEFFGGILLVLGLFTRTVAGIAAIEMLVAYFKVHAATDLLSSPLANKGELALLYAVCFLLLVFKGSGEWSIDNRIGRR